ncbi:MAG: potassium-transporting ATPase subunit KdpC [Proteobacteria bacterium]|nr:potassium-transporting ATPase subunit KdpC [Pseudomonadota bacterium]
MKTLWRPAMSLFVMLSVVTGAAYPMLVTVIAQALFPREAEGSLLTSDGTLVGSSLIGQNFTDPKFFWGRPSATGGWPNNGLASGGSNQGPLNPALLEAVQGRIAALRQADPEQLAAIPLDLVTASGSGLDPHISPAAAHFQAPRVARLRGMTVDAVQHLVAQHTEQRHWGVLGEQRVNVLELNLALEAR